MSRPLSRPLTRAERRRQIQANQPQPIPLGAELPDEIGQDLLVGAAAIAQFVFGSAQERRRVYYLAQAGELPVFQLGQTVCARRSTLLRFLEHRERVSLATAAEGAA